jgi:hypothetical protein
LFDGVEAGAYRFLAVKAGSVVISRSTKVNVVRQWETSVKLLALPTYGDVRVAGEEGVHRLVSEFLHVPVVEKGARGSLVEDGGIVLTDSGGMFVAG